jgi:glutamine amidotransferase-like uncharacterized protein
MINLYAPPQKSFSDQVKDKNSIVLEQCYFINANDPLNSHIIYLYQKSDDKQIKAMLIKGASKEELNLSPEMFSYYLKQSSKKESRNTQDTINTLKNMYDILLSYEEKKQLEKNIINQSNVSKKTKL